MDTQSIAVLCNLTLVVHKIDLYQQKQNIRNQGSSYDASLSYTRVQHEDVQLDVARPTLTTVSGL